MAIVTTQRSIVAQFVKWGSDPIRLNSFTVIQEKTGYRGETYLSRDEYDVEWCRRTGCYLYHMSGFGGGDDVHVMGPYHVSGRATIKEKMATWCNGRDRPPWRGKRTLKIRLRNKTRRLRQLPMVINQMRDGWDLLDWLEWNAINADAVYCSECDDWLPDTSNVPCDHVWWCDKSGWWSTPSDRCMCKNQDECFEREAA